MSIKLANLPYLNATVADLVGFWNAGLNASFQVMTYAVESKVSPHDVFFLAESQIPLLDLVQGEAKLFRKFGWEAIEGFNFKGALTAADQNLLRCFGHNAPSHFMSLKWYVNFPQRKKALRKVYEYARGRYRIRPSLRYLINGIKHDLALSKATDVDLQNDVSEECHINEDKFEDVTVVVQNILSNSIKYGSDKVNIDVWMDGAKLWFKDDGSGMNPEFAKTLGKGTPKREGRNPEIKGEGIGWQTIGKALKRNKWKHKINPIEGEGTIVWIDLGANTLYELKKPPDDIFSATPVRSRELEDIPNFAILCAEKGLFEGYGRNNDDMIDVFHSPIYKSILGARKLIEKLR